MQLQLRPPAPRFHPLMRRRGFSGLGQSNINPTTIWTPSGGWVGSGGPAVFVQPAVVPPPACVNDTQPGGAAYSQECQQQVIANNLQTIANRTAANYSVDRTNCETAWAENDARYASLGLPRPPNDCAERTFGLTLPGTTGGTSLDLPNAPALLDPSYAGPGAGAGAGAATPPTHPVLSFTNLTSGDNFNFKVGDRWQVQITGAPPNAPVTVSGGMSGGSIFASQGMTNQGTTDGNGNFSVNGQMTQAQIGNWSEAWSVGGVPISSFTFAVAPVSGTGGGQSTKTSTTIQSVFGTLPGGSLEIGSTSVPWLAIGAGVVVLFFLMRRG